jgi:hypothetical protein
MSTPLVKFCAALLALVVSACVELSAGVESPGFVFRRGLPPDFFDEAPLPLAGILLFSSKGNLTPRL